jgi:hypothetical protein
MTFVKRLSFVMTVVLLLTLCRTAQAHCNKDLIDLLKFALDSTPSSNFSAIK